MITFELNNNENIFTDTNRFTLQGNKIKFAVYSRIIITNQRFVYFDMGKMSPFYLQLGFLLKMFIKGKPVSLPLKNLEISRGHYAKNSKILCMSSEDGNKVLLDNYDKSLEWFSNILLSNGIALQQIADEKYRVSF